MKSYCVLNTTFQTGMLFCNSCTTFIGTYDESDITGLAKLVNVRKKIYHPHVIYNNHNNYVSQIMSDELDEQFFAPTPPVFNVSNPINPSDDCVTPLIEHGRTSVMNEPTNNLFNVIDAVANGLLPNQDLTVDTTPNVIGENASLRELSNISPHDNLCIDESIVENLFL